MESVTARPVPPRVQSDQVVVAGPDRRIRQHGRCCARCRVLPSAAVAVAAALTGGWAARWWARRRIRGGR